MNKKVLLFHKVLRKTTKGVKSADVSSYTSDLFSQSSTAKVLYTNDSNAAIRCFAKAIRLFLISHFSTSDDPFHLAIDVRCYLNTNLPKRWIGRRGPIE